MAENKYNIVAKMTLTPTAKKKQQIGQGVTPLTVSQKSFTEVTVQGYDTDDGTRYILEFLRADGTVVDVSMDDIIETIKDDALKDIDYIKNYVDSAVRGKIQIDSFENYSLSDELAERLKSEPYGVTFMNNGLTYTYAGMQGENPVFSASVFDETSGKTYTKSIVTNIYEGTISELPANNYLQLKTSKTDIEYVGDLGVTIPENELKMLSQGIISDLTIGNYIYHISESQNDRFIASVPYYKADGSIIISSVLIDAKTGKVIKLKLQESMTEAEQKSVLDHINTAAGVKAPHVSARDRMLWNEATKPMLGTDDEDGEPMIVFRPVSTL